MTRVDRTVLVPPPRREAYPPAATRGAEKMEASKTFGAVVDVFLWKGLQALQTHANQRSNPQGGGLDSVRANANGEQVTFTSAGSGNAVRVPHRLKRKPTAVVFFRGPDPNWRVIGNPDGETTGGFQNLPWTELEVYINSNAPAGEVFDVVIA